MSTMQHKPAGRQAGEAPLMLSVSGCRGVVGGSLTAEVLCRFAGAFAGWLRDGGAADGRMPTVVVGRDGRRGGPVIAQIVIGALRAAGCRVIDLRVAMTPTVGVMVTHHGADGGMVVTASHNPAQWNGLKCITRDGCAPDARSASAILDRHRAGRVALAPPDALGRLDGDDTAAHVHVARVLRALEPLVPLHAIKRRAFKVVVDSVNCSGAAPARMLLEALGSDVTPIHSDESGVFPHAPEPIEENLRELGAQTRALGADIGFAQDPDGDRLAIVDERGRFIGEEHTLALAAPLALRPAGRGACVAVNLSTSRMIEDIAAQFGARAVRTAVGEANVVEAMRRERCIFGGEGNGGVIWPEVALIRDSLSAMALTLGRMAADGATVSSLVDGSPRYAIVKRKIELDPSRAGLAQRAVDAIAKHYAKERVDLQDGVRVDFAGEPEWLHVRASNTEPIMRLIAEAPSAAKAGARLDEAARVVQRV